MSEKESNKFSGRCCCGDVSFRMESEPLFVHCCHCRWCQRETGAAFALNAMIETDRLTVLSGEPECVAIPSNSGKGQQVMRCPRCKLALWSYYGGAGELLSFVRVGTLDAPDRLPPDIHIFTASRQPWVQIPEGALSSENYYDLREAWPESSIQRRKALLASARAPN